MAFKDYVGSTSNKIVIGGAGIGLIIAATSALSFVRPALRVNSPDGERLWEVSTQGAIGVGTGANAFGANGECLQSGGGSGKLMNWGTCGSGGGGLSYAAAEGIFVNQGGDTMTGNLLVRATISGSSLRIDDLKNCDTIDTDTEGRLVCGTDQTGGSGAPEVGTAAFSGAVQIVGNGRYVKTQGDTVTGSLVVKQHISGSTIHVSQAFSGAGLTDCDAAGQTLNWDASDGRFECGTDADTNTTYTAGQGLGLTGTAFNTNTILTGSLVSFSTVSGALVKANNTLASSGTLVWEGAGSGSSLTVSSMFDGAGLDSCSNGITSKLLWNSTSKRFSCGTDTDTDTNTTYTAAQGLSLVGTAFRTNATLTGALANFSTVSGSLLKAKTTLASSGSLIWESAASGATLYVATSINGAGLTDCDLATQTLAWDATTGRFSCGTDADTNTTYTAGQGLTLTSTAFSLRASHTGSVIQASTTLASSGTLIWEGAASGASLYVATSLQGAGLTDCDVAGTSKLLWDAASGRFSCGTDQGGGGGGISYATAEGIFVNQGGDTMTGTLIVQTGAYIGGLRFINAAIDAPFTPVSNTGATLGTATGVTLGGSRMLVFNGDEADRSIMSIGGAGLESGLFAGGNANLQAGSVVVFDEEDYSFLQAGSVQFISGEAGNDAGEYAGSSSFIADGGEWNGATWNGGNFTFISGGATDIGGDMIFELGAGESGSDGNFTLYTNAGLQILYGHGDTGFVGINTTNPKTHLDVVGTVSGSVLYGNRSLRSSGSLSIEGSTAFRGVQYSWPLSTASSSGDVLKINPSNNQLSWSKDAVLSYIGPWTKVNLAASQTNAGFDRPMATILPAATTEVPSIRMPFAGSIRGISVAGNAARTAGSATFKVYVNGSDTGFSCVIDGTNTQRNACNQASGLDAFSAGDTITPRVTTDGTWAPATAEWAVDIWVDLTP